VSVQKRTQQTLRRRQTPLALFVFLITGLFGFLVRLLWVPERFGRVFHRLLGMFVASQVVLFAVIDGCRAVSVCCHFVKLSSSLVGIPRHNISFQKIMICRPPREAAWLEVVKGSDWFSFRGSLIADALHSRAWERKKLPGSVQAGIQRFFCDSQPRKFLAKGAHAIANGNVQFTVRFASVHEFKRIAR
jgi:drug/metabolite transporter superfamily protein YnfA